MLDLLKSFSNNLSFFYTMKIICEFVCQFILLVILIGMFILLIFINKKRRVYNYMRLCQKWPNNFIIKVVSLYFVDELLLCQSLGYGTREAINLIRSFKEEMPLSSFIAYHVDNNFRKGMPLNEALALPYLDRQLQRYSDIAVFSKEGLKTLDKYCLVSHKKMTKMLKNSALAIQIMIYLFIAFLIIIIYQILFLPMQVLSKF